MINSGTRNDEALEVAEQIVTVRAQLARLVEKFHALVGEARTSASSTGSTTLDRPGAKARRPRALKVPVQSPEESTPNSTGARILAVFTRQPGKKVAIQDVVTELTDIRPTVIRSTIARFARAPKRLKKMSRGVYKSVRPTVAGNADAAP